MSTEPTAPTGPGSWKPTRPLTVEAFGPLATLILGVQEVVEVAQLAVADLGTSDEAEALPPETRMDIDTLAAALENANCYAGDLILNNPREGRKLRPFYGELPEHEFRALQSLRHLFGDDAGGWGEFADRFGAVAAYLVGWASAPGPDCDDVWESDLLADRKVRLNDFLLHWAVHHLPPRHRGGPTPAPPAAGAPAPAVPTDGTVLPRLGNFNLAAFAENCGAKGGQERMLFLAWGEVAHAAAVLDAIGTLPGEVEALEGEKPEDVARAIRNATSDLDIWIDRLTRMAIRGRAPTEQKKGGTA